MKALLPADPAAHTVGLVISAPPGSRGLRHAAGLARAARDAGCAVHAVLLTPPAAEAAGILRAAGAVCFSPEQMAPVIAGATRVLHFS